VVFGIIMQYGFVLLEWRGRPSNSSLFNLLRSEAGLLKGGEKD
jgi:hypothetical protein